MEKKRYRNSKGRINGIGLNMKKYLHILKLRIYERLSFKISFRLFRELTSNERGELARWITRNVTESTAETLRAVRSGDYCKNYRTEYECDFIPVDPPRPKNGFKEIG